MPTILLLVVAGWIVWTVWDAWGIEDVVTVDQAESLPVDRAFGRNEARRQPPPTALPGVDEAIVTVTDAQPYKIYRARTYSEMIALAGADGLDSPDLLQLVGEIDLICILRQGGQRRDDRVDAKVPIDPVILSQRRRERFWNRFCDKDFSEYVDSEELMEARLASLESWRDSPAADARILRETEEKLRRTSADRLKEEDDRLRLARLIAETESPVLFRSSAWILIWRLGWRPRELVFSQAMKPPGLDLSLTLASCRIFGGCEAGSLIMALRCDHEVCAREMDIDTFLQEMASPALIRDANFLADVFIGWRMHGPDLGEQ